MLLNVNSAKWIAVVAHFILLLPVAAAEAADHLEAPALQGNGSVDITDLFLFPAAAENSSVMILAVNPFVASISGSTFNSDATYEFQFDNTGDAIPDITYSTTFAPVAGGRQSFSVARTDSAGTTTIATGVTGTAAVTNNGGLVQAGNFDDAFLHDTPADISAIILELPNSDFFGSSNSVGAQAVTTLFGVQQDRTGIPEVESRLLPPDRRDAFNAGNPADDLANFGAEINAAIALQSNQEIADTVTPMLLPNLLPYDASNTGGYFNGRALDDEVMDSTLKLFFEGVIPNENGGSGAPIRDEFPYLARLNAILDLGDVNLDYVVDFGDIPAFISILVRGDFQPEADCDQNNVVDFSDISAFIEILIGS